jgi:hypothetical protein
MTKEAIMARTIDKVTYLTVDEAAEVLATTPTRLLMLMRGKCVNGVLTEGEWLVTADSVASWVASGHDMKLEKGCAGCRSSAEGCACPGDAPSRQ